MNANLLIFSIGLCFLTPATDAQSIFRCESGDTVVFSDRPCQRDAETYQPQASFSVIASQVDYEAIAERNRAFIQRQHEHSAQRASQPRQSAPGARLNVSGISRRLPDQQRSVRRTTSEAEPRATSEATSRGASEADSRTTSGATSRTTSEADSRSTSEATSRRRRN